MEIISVQFHICCTIIKWFLLEFLRFYKNPSFRRHKTMTFFPQVLQARRTCEDFHIIVLMCGFGFARKHITVISSKYYSVFVFATSMDILLCMCFTHVEHWSAHGLELMKSVQICMVVTITVGACVCHCCSYPPWFSSLFSLCFPELRLLAFHRSHSFRTVIYGGYGCLVRLQNGYIFQLPQSARRWYISDHFCDCLVLQQENDVIGLQVYDELLKWGPSLRVYNGF